MAHYSEMQRGFVIEADALADRRQSLERTFSTALNGRQLWVTGLVCLNFVFGDSWTSSSNRYPVLNEPLDVEEVRIVKDASFNPPVNLTDPIDFLVQGAFTNPESLRHHLPNEDQPSRIETHFFLNDVEWNFIPEESAAVVTPIT